MGKVFIVVDSTLSPPPCLRATINWVLKKDTMYCAVRVNYYFILGLVYTT